MQTVAQAWLVLQISGSARLLGLDAFLGNIPVFLFSLVGGVIADRVSRRHLLAGIAMGAIDLRVHPGDAVRGGRGAASGTF